MGLIIMLRTIRIKQICPKYFGLLYVHSYKKTNCAPKVVRAGLAICVSFRTREATAGLNYMVLDCNFLTLDAFLLFYLESFTKECS